MHQLIYVFVINSVFLIESSVAQRQASPKNLMKFLQPLEIGLNRTYDSIPDDGIICSRNCTHYPDPRICYYKFVVEQYHAMGPACGDCPLNRKACSNRQCIQADGIERTVLSYNRMIPGPAVHVCYRDRIIIDVHNKMPGRSTTIHFHGELQQKSPWMDGVAYVTQCPINEGMRFRYDFEACTIGTHFLHSHESLQMFDGLSAPLIVRVSKKIEPISKLYDEDLFSHTIHIKDWTHMLSDNKYPGANKNLTLIGLNPDTYLINGKGAFMNPTTFQTTGTPFAEFHVNRNKRYRFRIINASSTTCSTELTFEGHSMLLIATDGYPIEAVEVRTLYMAAGDVYDVVITTNRAPRPYWIRVQGVDRCAHAFQYGVLMYKGSSTTIPSTPNTESLFKALPYPELNNVRTGCKYQADSICMDEIRSIFPAPERLLSDNVERIYLEIAAHEFSYKELYLNNKYYRHYLPESGPNVTVLGGVFTDVLNNITNVMTPFPLYSQPENPIPKQIICPEKCLDFCECLHLKKVPYNSVVEVVLVDVLSNELIKMDHPFHIHGHHFSVIALGTHRDREDPDFYKHIVKPKKPAIRDSVLVPACGFAVLRFIANNRGFWPLHCHFTAHNHNGMVVILQVGEREQFPPLPKNWPKCGNYLPPVY